jgi:hypothetical protein
VTRFLCARSRGHQITCTSTLGDDTAHIFDPTSHGPTAVTFAVTCALTRYGDIACYQGDATVAPVEAGPYRFVDAGRNVLCAIRVDGTTACWQHEDASGGHVEVGLLTPVSPPIDPDW